jgi:serine/threonine protein kinase
VFYDVMEPRTRVKYLAGTHFTLDEVRHDAFRWWFVLIQLTPQYTEGQLTGSYAQLLTRVRGYIALDPSLAYAADPQGRIAIEVAAEPMRDAIQSLLLWHGRYRVTEGPEHVSATCYIFKAVDEQTPDASGEPTAVALKLMRQKLQFRREVDARIQIAANPDHIVTILATHPEYGGPQQPTDALDARADAVAVEADVTRRGSQLTKEEAEQFFTVALPLADRNLFVAVKQERWAGKNMDEVRHVLAQLVRCVAHMHANGMLHADLKPLNIVRTGGQWKLIDLDAACAIGRVMVAHKCSTAYVPPEAIHVVTLSLTSLSPSPASPPPRSLHLTRYVPPEAIHVDEAAGTACPRLSVATPNAGGPASYELLTAHPSIDVWSLGCIFYQMVTANVQPLFQGNQDDNLTDDPTEEDNLFALAAWGAELKRKKLSKVVDHTTPHHTTHLFQSTFSHPRPRPLPPSHHNVLVGRGPVGAQPAGADAAQGPAPAAVPGPRAGAPVLVRQEGDAARGRAAQVRRVFVVPRGGGRQRHR